MLTAMIKPIKFKSRLLHVCEACEKTKYFKFSIPNDFTFIPGQYVLATIPTTGDKPIKRQYSIASSPATKDHIELAITKVDYGPGSTHFFRMKKGDEIEFMGPMGLFTMRENELQNDVVFISTGTGIAPFRSMSEHLLKSGFSNKITVIAGYRYEEDILYEGEMMRLNDEFDNFEYLRILSRPRLSAYEGPKGHVEILINEHWEDLKDRTFYICGLKAMLDETCKLLETKGIPKDRIRFERYD